MDWHVMDRLLGEGPRNCKKWKRHFHEIHTFIPLSPEIAWGRTVMRIYGFSLIGNAPSTRFVLDSKIPVVVVFNRSSITVSPRGQYYGAPRWSVILLQELLTQTGLYPQRSQKEGSRGNLRLLGRQGVGEIT